MSDNFQKRLTSSLGIAVIFMMAFGVLWQAMPVPTAFAIDTISVAEYLDMNHDGAIDEIKLTLDENATSCTYDTSGAKDWVVTTPGDLNIAITNVGCGGLDPYIHISVTADPGETSDFTHTVISYSNQGVADSIVLASGPMTDKAAITVDVDHANPVIVSAVYLDSATADGTVDTIRTTWSENVTQDADADVTDYTIVGGDITAVFGSSGADLGGDAIIDITITADALETGVNGGTQPTILYVAGSHDPVHDEYGVPNHAVARGAGALTVTDSAAPFLRTDGSNAPKYTDANSDGTIDRVQLVFTENTTLTYDDTDWTITAQDLTGLDVTALNSGSGTTTILLTATASALRTGINGGTEPTIAFSDAAHLTDGTNPLTTIGTISLTDGAAPQISTLGYSDNGDSDGKIDRIYFTFTESVIDTSTFRDTDFSINNVGDFTSLALTSTGSDLISTTVTGVYIDMTEASVVDTYDDSGNLNIDTAGGFVLVDDSVAANVNSGSLLEPAFIDQAKPVIATATPTDASTAQSRTNSVVYTFSEPMAADTWAEATDFTSTPHGSGWSGSMLANATSITLTHSPFLCVQSYSIAFDPTTVLAVNGSGSYTQLNNASTAPIGATHTFTTMSCPSSGSSSYVAPTVDDEEETVTDEEDTATDEEDTTTDEEAVEETPTTSEQTYSPVTGELEDISVVSAGDFIKSPYFATVYYVTSELTRRPFMNSQTFFTYADSFAEVKIVTDATLTTLPLGSVMLPNPGVVLVKIQSNPKVYAIDETNSLRWITTEAVAISLYGSNWADYIIDIEPTFFTKFGQGTDIDDSSDITVSDEMKKRAELAE